MVYFTCNHCGESVKKPSVEKHYIQNCRGAKKFLSCMDCLKDFRGEDYAAHTKCITEAEKYSGKDFVPKQSKNTGQKKQEGWLAVVRTALDTNEFSLTPDVRSVIQKMQSYENIPRKKPKFYNFISNCMKCRGKLADAVWDVLEKANERAWQKNSGNTNGVNKTNGDVETSNHSDKLQDDPTEEIKENGVKEETDGKIQKKNSKRKPVDESNTNSPTKKHKPNEDTITNGDNQELIQKFDWKEQLLKIVQKHTNGIEISKVKKKLLRNYKKIHSLDETDINIDKKFKKYSKKLSLTIEDDIVKLSS